MSRNELIQRLENAVQKLKQARLEVHAAIAEALAAKENGDNIGDQAVSIAAALLVDDFEAFSDQAEREKEIAKRVRAA